MNLKLIGGGVLVAAIAGVGYILWDKLSAPRPVGTESVIAIEAPAVRKAPRVKVAIKKPVETIQGAAKANLKLPAAVQADPNQQVVAASQIKSDLHSQTVSTVINTETGKTETFVKQDPYPWFAVETRGEIKLAHGYKWRAIGSGGFGYNNLDTARVTRLQIDYDVVRVKALTLGVTGTLDTDRDAFVGVGLSYKW